MARDRSIAGMPNSGASPLGPDAPPHGVRLALHAPVEIRPLADRIIPAVIADRDYQV